MSDVLTVARHDGKVVRRSRLLWGVVAIYVAILAIIFYPAGGGDDASVQFTILGAMWLTTLLFPLVAIVGSYLAISGERESRTIRFLLSQPVARHSVVLGKFLSRGVTLGVAFLLAIGVGTAIIVGMYTDPVFDPLLTFTGLSLLLILAFVAVAVGISAAVASRSRAIAATIGYYFVAVVLSVFPGVSIQSMLQELGSALELGLDRPMYHLFGSLLSPAVAYLNATMATFPPEARILVPENAPSYLGTPVQTAVLLAWIVVPLVLGSLLLRRAQIG